MFYQKKFLDSVVKMSYICSEVVKLEIKSKKPRYINIRATNDLYNEILAIAKKNDTTMTEVTTNLVILGLKEYKKK